MSIKITLISKRMQKQKIQAEPQACFDSGKKIKPVLKKFLFLIFLFVFGAAGYFGLEILWRGYSHWSMAFCGGTCMVLLHNVDKTMAGKDILKKSAAGCCIITVIELIAGCVVNMALHLKVWDYTNMPGNILGQICLPFTLVWFVLCLAIFGIMEISRRIKMRRSINNTI